ncbi:MAG TPA: Na+/H+ antiporter subunit D [Jiangellaceae bacterium]
MNSLVTLPVALPLFGAGLALAMGRNRTAQWIVSVTTLTIVTAIAASMVVVVDRDGPLLVTLGNWPGDLGISLVADRFSALMVLVSTVVSLCVLFYSLGQGLADGTSATPMTIYHPTYLVLNAGVSNAFLAGDLFNLFVGFEILLIASFVLLTIGGTGPRMRAGTVYVVVSILSSMLFLMTIGLVYAATGTVNLALLAARLDELPDGLSLVLQLLLLVTFSVKAAVFPLSAWLPDSYPTAPAPVTAVFAGLLTKVGIYAIVRTQTLLFPDSPLSTLLMWAAMATMIVGILGAIAQTEIKRILSFTLVSHIGYMVFGVALASPLGLASTIYYVVHHITVQSTLFLVAGLIERRGRSTSLERLGGLARLSPLLAVLYFIPATSLAGIPPFSGFIGKVGLMQAGVDDGGPLALALVAAGALTSLLTLYAIGKIWSLAFWRSRGAAPPLPVAQAPREGVDRGDVKSDDGERTTSRTGAESDQGVRWHGGAQVSPARDVSAAGISMAVPTAALVGFGLLLTVAAGPLFGYAERSAQVLQDRDSYIETMLESAFGSYEEVDE